MKEYNLLIPNSIYGKESISRQTIKYSDLEILEQSSKQKLDREIRQKAFKQLKTSLAAQIKREGYLYLNTMKGILDKGRSYIQGSKYFY